MFAWKIVSHPRIAAFDLSWLSHRGALRDRLNRQREKDGLRLLISYWSPAIKVKFKNEKVLQNLRGWKRV